MHTAQEAKMPLRGVGDNINPTGFIELTVERLYEFQT